MKSEWKMMPLQDFVEFNPKEVLKKGAFAKKVPMEALTPFQRQIAHCEKAFYQGGTKFRNGDTIMARITPCLENGKVAFVSIFDADEVGFGSTEYVVFRAKEGISDAMFVYYLVRSDVVRLPAIKSMVGSSGRQRVQDDVLRKLDLILPSLPTQRKIAAILSSLDDKIENNNAICKNLEEQAAALYKSWFVDFEPFGGQLPKSWRERDIYSIAKVIYGAPFSSKLFNSVKRGVPILRIRDLKKQDSDVYTDEVHPKAYVISPGDIVVGMDGEFQPHIWGGVEGLLNQRVCVFRNMRPKGSFFLYFTILPQLNFIEKTEMATTVIHIGKKDFDAFRVLVPTDDVLEKFDALSDPMYKEIVSLRQENRRLFSLRDTLLPKLMSGELEVDKVAI